MFTLQLRLHVLFRNKIKYYLNNFKLIIEITYSYISNFTNVYLDAEPRSLIQYEKYCKTNKSIHF